MELFVKPYDDRNTSVSNEKPNVQYITDYHIACVLLIDISGSLYGEPIKQLNAGLQGFRQQILNDPSLDDGLKRSIDIAVVTFGSEVNVVQDFVPAPELVIPEFTEGGTTPLGLGLDKALDLITARKKAYHYLATPYYRPWVFCITDGEPTDDYHHAASRLKEMEHNRGVLGYCVGVGNLNYKTMAKIFEPKRIFALEGHDFVSMFEFVSNSMAAIASSDPTGETKIDVELPESMHRVEIEF